ncbi:MAG: glycine oxidase ThiO [Gammaproteobacteria bacterium]|nr:glycine oxidase ThiO [Gammaproteobacteria bacterium]
MYDCLVVGGGLIGMLTARELSTSGLSVAIVEQGECGRESSWAGGGILSPLYPWRYAYAVTALASWSQTHYPAFIKGLYQETGIDPEFQQNGLLILDTDESERALSWARLGQSSLQQISFKEIKVLEPQLGVIPDSALWMPEVGQIRNPRMVKSMRESLLKQGVKLYENSQVQGLFVDQDYIKGVVTAEGEIRAKKVVLAGGAWTSQLLSSTGVNLAIKPVRGQMILFRGEPGLISRIVLSQDRYVIPRRDGRVLFGSTLEDTGFDKSITDSAREELQQAAYRLIPALKQYEIEHHWAGLRPASPEGIPYIGEHPHITGLYINTGHYRNGVVLGLASARLLADMMLQREPIMDFQAFKIK